MANPSKPIELPSTTTIPKINPTLLLANLVRVRIPTHAGDPATAATNATPSAPIQKTYHYEDANHPTLLTGISLQGQGSDGQATNQRLVSWAYDKAGRGAQRQRCLRQRQSRYRTSPP